MFNIYWTDPGTQSLLGFEFQPIRTIDHETGEKCNADMLSIGLFIARIDIIFNMTPIQEEKE